MNSRETYRSREAGRRVGRCGPAKKQALAREKSARWVRFERQGHPSSEIVKAAEWIDDTTRNEGTDGGPAVVYLWEVYEAAVQQSVPDAYVALMAELRAEAAIEGAENIESFRFAAKRRPELSDIDALISALAPSVECQLRCLAYARLLRERMAEGDHRWAA